MADIKFHSNLNLEKWQGYERDRQVLMIANELNRAKSCIEREKFENIAPCYERALELADLTIEDKKWNGRRRELLRFREYLAELYFSGEVNPKVNNQLYNGIISLSVEAYNMLHGN